MCACAVHENIRDEAYGNGKAWHVVEHATADRLTGMSIADPAPGLPGSSTSTGQGPRPLCPDRGRRSGSRGPTPARRLGPDLGLRLRPRTSHPRQGRGADPALAVVVRAVGEHRAQPRCPRTSLPRWPDAVLVRRLEMLPGNAWRAPTSRRRPGGMPRTAASGIRLRRSSSTGRASTSRSSRRRPRPQGEHDEPMSAAVEAAIGSGSPLGRAS
jgi:hypothetical protein